MYGYCKIDGFSRAIFSHCDSDFLKIDLKKIITVKSAFGRFCIFWISPYKSQKHKSSPNMGLNISNERSLKAETDQKEFVKKKSKLSLG